MTAKEFFKSNAFKCLITLLAVLLFSGVLLTVAYGFLEVSAGEKLQRAVKKIYGDAGEFTVYGLNDQKIDENNSNPESLVPESITVGDATVTEAYKIVFASPKGSEEYLVQSVGKGGYSGGTVTCWVTVKVNSTAKKVTGVGKVTVAGNVGQSFIGKVTDDMLSKFSKNFTGGEITPFYTDDGYVATGASLSSTAICNAVNGAVKYVDKEVFGNEDFNPYEEWDLTEYIDTGRTKHEVTGDEVKYNIWTKGYGYAGGANIEITVKEGKITYYHIVKPGSTNEYEELIVPSINDGTVFIGKGIDFFTDAFGENMSYEFCTIDDGNIVTGATDENVAGNSGYLCMYAGAFATKNYENALGGAENE